MRIKNTKKLIIFLLFLVQCYYPVLAHQNSNIAQLEGLLLEIKNDTAAINVMNDLAYNYYTEDIQMTFYYAEKALKQSKAIDYPIGIVEAKLNLHIANAVSGNHTKGLKYSEEALVTAKILKKDALIARSLNNISLTYQTLGFYEKALVTFKEASEYAHQGDDEKLYCLTLFNIGDLYIDLDQKEKANHYYDQAVAVAKKSDHHMLQHLPAMFEGNKAKDAKDFKKAIQLYEEALSKAVGNTPKSEVLETMANIFEEQKLYEKAKEKILESISLSKATGDTENLPQYYLKYSNILFKNGEFSTALKTIDQVLEHGKQFHMSIFLYRSIYQLQADIHTQLQDHQSANLSYLNLIKYQDSIFNKQELDVIAREDAKDQIKAQEKENVLLRNKNAQNEASMAQSQKLVWSGVWLLILFFGISLLLFWAFYTKRNFNKQLQNEIGNKTFALRESNKQLKVSYLELERFAYIASHDLKEPLRNIASFSNLIERRLNNSNEQEDIQEYASFIKKNTSIMNQLIEDVLEYSNQEKINAILEPTDISLLLGQVLQNLEKEILAKNAVIQLPASLPTFVTYQSQVFMIFKNLIGNAIKFNESEKIKVTISHKELDGYHKFSVIDNGIGIELKYQERIFEMFKRLHNRNEYPGSGLGLAMCKKIINKMGGQIYLIPSEVGSHFCFTIPKNNDDKIPAAVSDVDLTSASAMN